MKRTLFVVALALFFSATNANADLATHVLNIEGFGASSSNASTPELISSTMFTLPGLDSLNGVGIQLAHDYGSDVTLELIAPGGATFLILEGQGQGASPHQGGFDSDELGNSGTAFLLANVVDYTIVPNGTTGTNWLSGGSPLPSGIYDQRLVGSESWASGAFAAGDWTLNLYDSWDTEDAGSVGTVSLSYTASIPEPGFQLGCVFALLAVFSRRPRRAV